MVACAVRFLKRETLYILSLDEGVRRSKLGDISQVVVLPTTKNGARKVPCESTSSGRSIPEATGFCFSLGPEFLWYMMLEEKQVWCAGQVCHNQHIWPTRIQDHCNSHIL